ncbi:Guanylate-binding protein 1 [Triplophysa tibetana]|uniref:Guanylate-binding protein 1 n=1 Tax=Triplophysa tibetana TaxID=1572043 RepID=A0A5A9P8F6_9TELE|nr:Guanylate-binding protein 1 [Triplophysa tibetana]
MSQASPMLRPICLVKNVCGSLQVCTDAIEFLNGINQPVVVVSVVGLYRTGKSYLMNRLAGQQKGFALGNTIESKTKGIWMWCVPHPFEAGQTLVLLDTEGLGDIDKGDSKNDGWIFCLAVLLSSTLVYNSRGTIDNDTIQKLHYITEISEQIKIRSAEAGEEGDEDSQFVRFFPLFVWVVRDFTLSLEIDGNEVTEDEYLDFALQLKKASPDNMRRLENLQERDIVQGFLETTGRFCEYIFDKSPVKTLKGGHRVTGKLLGQLAQIYVETLSSGKVPCLDNAVVALANLENKAAVQEAFKVYKSGMEKVKNNFPVSVTDFTSEHQKFSKLATSEFMKCSFKDDKGDYLKQLVQDIDMCYVVLMEENEMASKRKCKGLLKDLFSEMNKRLQNVLGQLAQIYVETLSSGKVPCLDNAVVALANLENKAAVQEAFKVYKSGMEKVKNNFPVSVTDFTSEHQKFSKLATSEFMKCSFKDDKGDYLKQLVQDIDMCYVVLMEENEMASKRKCKGLLKDLFSEMNNDCRMVNTVSVEDIKSTAETEMSSLHKEKEKTALLEQKRKEEKEKHIESERMLEVEQERRQDRMKQKEEKVKKEMEQQQEEIKRAVESKVKEQEALMNKGFKEKAELMEDEIKI